MRPLTLVLLYYNTPELLGRQLAWIREYPADVLSCLHVVLVDDGSPRPAEPIVRRAGWGESGPASFRLYRTLVDVVWNEEFATNLGVSQVATEWFLHTDLDHQVPAATLRGLMSEKIVYDPRVAYKLSRFVKFDDGAIEETTPSMSSWFITKGLFEEAGGLDERFSGRYAPSDRDFEDRVRRVACVSVLDAVLVVHYGVGDESGVERDRAGADKIYDAVVAERGSDATVRLTFPWERVL